jgi:hypothetical protein
MPTHGKQGVRKNGYTARSKGQFPVVCKCPYNCGKLHIIMMSYQPPSMPWVACPKHQENRYRNEEGYGDIGGIGDEKRKGRRRINIKDSIDYNIDKELSNGANCFTKRNGK